MIVKVNKVRWEEQRINLLIFCIFLIVNKSTEQIRVNNKFSVFF